LPLTPPTLPQIPSRRPLLPALLILVAPLLAVSLFSPGSAQAGPADRESALRWFDGVDSDHNGVIDVAEIDRVRDKRFRRYDGDGDGYITLDEFNFSLPEELGDEIERRARRFAVMDLDDDDELTKDEYMRFGGRVAAAADLDGDGVVTREEFATAVAPQ
jgi:Ca2+-binding EF-hand superfamily protein